MGQVVDEEGMAVNCWLRLRRHEWWPMLKAFDESAPKAGLAESTLLVEWLRVQLVKQGATREVCVRCGRLKR